MNYVFVYLKMIEINLHWMFLRSIFRLMINVMNNNTIVVTNPQIPFYYRKTFYNKRLKIDPEPLRTRYELTVLTPSGVLLLPQ